MAKKDFRFAATVSDWVKESKSRQLAWVRTTLQDLDREIALPVARGGNMPVVTGNLRRSRLASTDSMPGIGEREFKADPGGQITGVIANLRLGQKFFYGFQAIYARRVEEVRGFLRLGLQRFQVIADAAARKVQARVTMRNRST